MPYVYIAPIFGTGKDGRHISSSNEDINSVRQSCSISSNSNALQVTSDASFSLGDLVFIHKSRGSTNAWKYRWARVTAKPGSNILTLDRNIDIAFADSGVDQSQVVLVKEYTSWKINSGITVSPAAWDQDKGGICVAVVQGTFENLGTLNGDSAGYRAGTQSAGASSGLRGEGNLASNTGQISSANGTGAGSGLVQGTGPGNSGAGGGHYAVGGNGPRHFEFSADGNPSIAQGGGIFGDDDFTVIGFGGAGSAGAHDNGGGSTVGNGGHSGGMLIVFARKFKNTSGVITCKGQSTVRHPSNHNGTGGGGSGGSVWIVTEEAEGINNINVDGGIGEWGCAQQHGNIAGNGSRGRIRIETGKVTDLSTNANAVVVSTLQAYRGKLGPSA